MFIYSKQNKNDKRMFSRNQLRKYKDFCDYYKQKNFDTLCIYFKYTSNTHCKLLINTFF